MSVCTVCLWSSTISGWGGGVRMEGVKARGPQVLLGGAEWIPSCGGSTQLRRVQAGARAN